MLQENAGLVGSVHTAIETPRAEPGDRTIIGRGADLRLYVLALGSIAVALHFFDRVERVEARLTKLVRALALEDGLRRDARRADP